MSKKYQEETTLVGIIWGMVAVVVGILVLLAVMACAAYYYEKYSQYVVAGFLALIVGSLIVCFAVSRKKNIQEFLEFGWFPQLGNWLAKGSEDLDAKLSKFSFQTWIALAGGLTVIMSGCAMALEIHQRQFGLIAVIIGAIGYMIFWNKKTAQNWKTKGQLISILCFGMGIALLDQFSSGLILVLIGIGAVAKVLCPKLTISITWPKSEDDTKQTSK